MYLNCELPSGSLILFPLQLNLSCYLPRMRSNVQVMSFEIVLQNFRKALVGGITCIFFQTVIFEDVKCPNIALTSINLLLKCSTRLSSEVARSTTYRPSKLPMHNQLLSLQRPTQLNTVSNQFFPGYVRNVMKRQTMLTSGCWFWIQVTFDLMQSKHWKLSLIEICVVLGFYHKRVPMREPPCDTKHFSKTGQPPSGCFIC